MLVGVWGNCCGMERGETEEGDVRLRKAPSLPLTVGVCVVFSILLGLVFVSGSGNWRINLLLCMRIHH